MFKVGDKVWAMRADKPEELKVFAVIECLNTIVLDGNSIIFYQLVHPSSQPISLHVKSYGELPGTRYKAHTVHATKKQLLDSFL